MLKPARRSKVENASKYVAIENLSLCPNCGFSGSAADAWVTEDVEKRKLAVLVDAAREIW
jgi:5-methyltetrahydropteroyltriglutamate--homocysteine methyltransferase